MADYSRLNGSQRAAVRAAFLSAFTRDELKMLLSDRLDKRWDNYTRDGGNLQEQVYDLIEHSQAEGWIDALIREAEAQRPTNRYFALIRCDARADDPDPISSRFCQSTPFDSGADD